MVNTGIAVLIVAVLWLAIWELVKWRWKDRGARMLFVVLILALSLSLLTRDHNNRAVLEAWFDFIAAAGMLSWLVVS